jgi:hypothetical protein
MYAVPNVDIFSRYYNYALENTDQQSVPITQDFVFAQEEPGNMNQFKIGFSVTSNLVDVAGPGPVYMTGPSIPSTPAAFTI